MSCDFEDHLSVMVTTISVIIEISFSVLFRFSLHINCNRFNILLGQRQWYPGSNEIINTKMTMNLIK